MRCHVESIPKLIAELSGKAMELPPQGQSCEGQLHRHHWMPRQDGGPNTNENLVALCEKHHVMVHRIMAIYGRGDLGQNVKQREFGWTVQSDDDLPPGWLRGQDFWPSGQPSQGDQLSLFTPSPLAERPSRVEHRAPQSATSPRHPDLGTTCKVCGRGGAGLEMCVIQDGLVHMRCSHHRRTPVCSADCSVQWMELTGH